MDCFHPQKDWTQKRTHTTIILLKIRVNHGILILIEVHPLEKNLFDSKKNGAKKPRNKSYSTGKGKVLLENIHLRKGAGHNRAPTEQSDYCGSGLLMDYHLENCLGAMLYWAFHKTSCIWEIRHLEKPQKMELSK